MSRTRWVGGVATTAVAVGALFVGSGTAFADGGTPGPAPEAGSNERVCAERIPRLLARIDQVTARINGDVSTRGSTAWLEAKQAAARSSGWTALADLIEVRLSHRPQRLAELAQVKGEVEQVRSANCGS
jgi:hypothetical protein